MNKLAKLIAAVHASMLTSSAFVLPAAAQDAGEIRAYMEAVKAGTPDAIMIFLQSYPDSTLPGSELGARITASIGKTAPAPTTPTPGDAEGARPAWQAGAVDRDHPDHRWSSRGMY